MRLARARGLWRSSGVVIGLVLAGRVFAAAGDLDTTFGQYGRVAYSIDGTSVAVSGVWRQSDGKLAMIASTTSSTSDETFSLVKLNADGSPDLGFGTAGRVQLNFGGPFDGFSGVAQQPDGKFVIASNIYTTPGSRSGSMVYRFNSDGTPDTGFGTGARVSISSNSIGPIVRPTIQSDGKIVIAGWRVGSSTFGFSAIRLLATGAMDATFGSGGLASVPMPTINGYGVSGVIALPDGRVVVHGTTFINAVPRATVVRFTATGQTDTTFNGTGAAFTPCASPTGSCAWSDAVLQPDQKLLLSGTTGGLNYNTTPATIGQYGTIIGRLNSNGSVDTGFGTNGLVTGVFATAFYGQPLHVGELMRDIALDANGNILALGNTANMTYTPTGNIAIPFGDTVVARLTGTGVIDQSFGYNGYSIIDYSLGSQAAAASPTNLLLLPDSSPIVIATRVVTANSGVGLARLSNGPAASGLIRAFGAASKVTEAGGSAVFRVRRVGGTSGSVSVNYSTRSGTATSERDFLGVSGTLIWADGESSERVVVIPVNADNLVETEDEAIEFDLSSATGGARVDGVPASVSITRNDIPPELAFRVSQSAVAANEGQGSATVTVTRSGNAVGNAAVHYYTLPGSARAGQDYTAVNGTIEWPPGVTGPRTITIPVIDDPTGEGVENFHVLLSSSAGAVMDGGIATISLADNDSAPQILMSTPTVAVSESQTSVTLNVFRNGLATQAASVNFATIAGTAGAGSDFTATTGTLTWLPTDPNLKTITIPLVTDGAVESNESFSVILSAVTGATLGTDTTTLTIMDDDVNAPTTGGSGGGNGNGSGSGGGGGALSTRLLIGLLLLAVVSIAMRPNTFRLRGRSALG